MKYLVPKDMMHIMLSANVVVRCGKNYYYDSESSDDNDEDQVLYAVYLLFTSVNYQISYFCPI